MTRNRTTGCDVTDSHELRKLEMAAMGSGRGTMDSQNQVQSDNLDRLKLLYPNVNEDETPLPRSWSTKDKFSYIGLSQNNLRVHYKGKIQGLFMDYLFAKLYNNLL